MGKNWPAVLLLAAALLLAAFLTVLGLVWRDRFVVSIGLLCLVVVFTGIGLAAAISANWRRAAGFVGDLNALIAERLEQFSVMLNLISEQQLISERSKAVAFREKERDTIYRAIREDMARRQYDAALLLVNEMENTLGHKEEAERLRAEIAQLRDSATRRSLAEVISQIDRLCSAEKWDEAIAGADQLAAGFPGHDMTAGLPLQVRTRRESRKQHLLAQWREAVARKDIDASVDALRALDIYVSSEEVAELKQGALEIFKVRIVRLREQFMAHVRERRWNEAIEAGETLVQEFPTNRIAQEVRDALPGLRARIGEEAPAASADRL